MTRRIVLLNLALLALAGILVWTLRGKRAEAKKREAAVLRQVVAPKPVIEPPPARPLPPVTPGSYLPVAENMLFSKDRNPTVVIEPPPVKPEPPMPPLPRYHGQMAIGEPVALLSTDKLEQKGYHAGDAIGDFTLVSFDREKIAFQWMGKTVERKPEDLAPKVTVAQTAPAAPRAAQPNSPAAAPAASSAAPAASGFINATSAASAATSLSGPSAAATPSPTAPANPAGMGDDLGDGVHNCLPGDTSPAGTVRDGKKKTVMQSMFGPICRWEPVR